MSVPRHLQILMLRINRKMQPQICVGVGAIFWYTNDVVFYKKILYSYLQVRPIIARGSGPFFERRKTGQV